MPYIDRPSPAIYYTYFAELLIFTTNYSFTCPYFVSICFACQKLNGGVNYTFRWQKTQAYHIDIYVTLVCFCNDLF